MNSSIRLITCWLFAIIFTAVLLAYRLLLRHHDRELLKMSPAVANPLHTILQNRMTLIDRWGVCLTISAVVYLLLLVLYLLYDSFERIAQQLLRLMSYL
jgi:hypothetical protein